MADLTHLSNELRSKKSTCRAVIETPKGSRNKFDYDPDSNLFMLGGLLPEGMMFDFGFIPSTLADDGDPLDVMVLMDAPVHAGCLIEVRLIGIIHAKQTEDGKRSLIVPAAPGENGRQISFSSSHDCNWIVRVFWMLWGHWQSRLHRLAR